MTSELYLTSYALIATRYDETTIKEMVGPK
jgi:hypothetical protein